MARARSAIVAVGFRSHGWSNIVQVISILVSGISIRGFQSSLWHAGVGEIVMTLGLSILWAVLLKFHMTIGLSILPAVLQIYSMELGSWMARAVLRLYHMTVGLCRRLAAVLLTYRMTVGLCRRLAAVLLTYHMTVGLCMDLAAVLFNVPHDGRALHGSGSGAFSSSTWCSGFAGI